MCAIVCTAILLLKLLKDFYRLAVSSYSFGMNASKTAAVAAACKWFCLSCRFEITFPVSAHLFNVKICIIINCFCYFRNGIHRISHVRSWSYPIRNINSIWLKRMVRIQSGRLLTCNRRYLFLAIVSPHSIEMVPQIHGHFYFSLEITFIYRVMSRHYAYNMEYVC